MPRLAFIFRTDVHVTDKSPSSWKGDYPAEVWSSLRQVGALAREHAASAVLDGGDYFHVKSATRNPHALVRQTAEIHREYPCPTWCIEGNHDIVSNNLDSIERQPLGVLYATKVFGHLREEVFRDGNLQVRVVGVPYSPLRTLEDLHRIQKRPGDTHLIVVAHALAGPNPPSQVEDFFHEPVFRYSEMVPMDGADVVCLGHWHKDQGIVTVGQTRFVNQGALSRGALVRENLERTPKATLIEIDGPQIRCTSLPMEVLPAAEVFDLERKAQQEARHDAIEQFTQRLVTEGSTDPSKDIFSNIRSLGKFAKSVQDRAIRYLEMAEVG